MLQTPPKSPLDLTESDFQSMWEGSAQKSSILSEKSQALNFGVSQNASKDGEINSLIAVYGGTELMYFRARYYSGELGRFVSRDPLMYVDGMSLYSSYFHVNGVDPSGMFSGGGGQWMGGNPGWNPGCHSTFHGIKSPGIFEDFVKRAIPRLVKIKKTIRVIKWTSCGPVVVLTTVTVYALVWGGKTPPTCNQFQMKYNPKYYMNQKSG